MGASCFSEIQLKLKNVSSSDLRQEPNVFKLILLVRKTAFVQSKSLCGQRINPSMGVVWLKNKLLHNSETLFVQLNQLCCAVQLCSACSNNLQGVTGREGTAALFLFQCTSLVI